MILAKMLDLACIDEPPNLPWVLDLNMLPGPERPDAVP